MKNKKITLTIIVIIVLASLIYFFSYDSKNYDNFAKCLTENGIKFYGTFWCDNCAKQKKLFGNSVQYLNYIECDSRGKNPNPELCQEKKITGYPTWEINGNLVVGVQDLETLSELTNCKLNN